MHPAILDWRTLALSAYVPTTATVTAGQGRHYESTGTRFHTLRCSPGLSHVPNANTNGMGSGPEREFSTMLELNPSSAIGHDQYGFIRCDGTVR